RGIQGIKLEEVPMRFPLGWSGAAVAGLLEVVVPLPRAFGHAGLARHPFGEGARLGRQIEEDPMNPISYRCIGVVANQGQTLGSFGDSGPREWRRYVLAVAGVRLWNGLAFAESSARDLHGQFSFLLRRGISFITTTAGHK